MQQPMAQLGSIVGTVLIFSSVHSVFAHSFGQTINESVGDYVIDIDYDTPAIVARQPVRFDFNLLVATTREFVIFDNVGVAVRPGGTSGMTFAGVLSHPDAGSANMTLTFPQAGRYSLSVRYYVNDVVVAEAVFPFEVGGVPAQGPLASLFTLAVGVVLGLAIAWLIKKKRS